MEWMQKLKRHRWNLRELEECFEMIPKRNTFHFNFVMSVYAKRKKTRRVEELFERMREENVPQDIFTYTTLMNAYGTNPKKAEEVLTRMKEAGVKPNDRTYNTLMNAYGTNHTKAEEVLRRMKKAGVKPDVTTYTTLMNACGTNSTEAEEVLIRMKKAGVTPDVTTYTTLMNVYGTNSTKAEEVLTRMIEAGVKPDVTTYTTLMNAYGTNSTKAEKVLIRMIEAGEKPNVTTYTTLMNAYGTNSTKAEKVLTRMIEAGEKPNVTTYTTLMNAYGTNSTKAEKVLTRMIEAGEKPNVTTYTTLMNAYGTNSTKAEKVLTRMIEAGEKPNVTTYTTLMNAYGTNSTKAEKVLIRMIEAGEKPNVTTYTTLMNAYGTNSTKAEKVLTRMIEAGEKPNVTTYNTLMNAYGTNSTKAEKVLTRMIEAGEKPDVTTYTTLMNAYGTNSTKAEKVLIRMIEAGEKPNVTTYTTLMNAYGTNSTKAEKVLTRMIEAGEKPNVTTYNTLMNAYGTNSTKAEKVLKRMIEAGEKPDVFTYNALMNAYGTNHIEAKKVFERMIEAGEKPDVTTYNTLMNSYGTNSTKAEKVLKRMIEAGEKPDVFTYTTLMYACQRHPSEVHEYFNEMLRLKIEPNKHTFATLIVAYARQRDTKAIHNILEQMKTYNIEPNDIIFAICAHAHYSNPDSFWKGLDMLCNTMETCGPSSHIFHPWLHTIINKETADPRSILVILEQIRRLPIFRKGLSQETWIAALDMLHQILSVKPPTVISCIQTLLRQMALSDIASPSFESLERWSCQASKHAPSLSKMYERIIDDEIPKIQLRTNQFKSNKYESQMKDLDETLYKDSLLDLKNTTIRRLWCDDHSTKPTIGSGGFKVVLGVEINHKAYALILPKSMYESNMTTTSDSSSDSSSGESEPGEGKEIKSILQELKLMHELRDTKHAVRVRYKFRGLPMFALQLCALKSLKSFVQSPSSSSRFDWHRQIVPNLPFALELILGTIVAVEELHDGKIVHLDLKSDNFLVASSETKGVDIKIADMGLSCKLEKGPICKKCAGTATFMAPEVVKEERNVWFWTDVWSLACVALEILSGKAPFYGLFKSMMAQDLLILYAEEKTPLSHLAPKGSSQLFQEFDEFVPKDAGDENRKAYDGVCETMYNMLSDCFSFDPKKRPTVREMKACVMKCLDKLEGIRESRFWHVRKVITLNPSQEELNSMLDLDAKARNNEERSESAQREFSKVLTSSNGDFLNHPANSTAQPHDTQSHRQIRKPKSKSPKRTSKPSSKRDLSKAGTVKFYHSLREFGYIIPDDGGTDVCFHKRSIVDIADSLSKIRGSSSSVVRVEFIEDRKSRQGKRFAFRVRLINDSSS